MARKKEYIEFTCKTCVTAVILGGYNQNQNKENNDENGREFPKYQRKKQANKCNNECDMHQCRVTDSGFVFVTNGKEKQSLGTKLHARAAVMDTILSSPSVRLACSECTDTMHDELDKQIKLAKKDSKEHNNYLLQLRQSDDIPNLDELKKELNELEMEEKRLTEELKNVKDEEESAKESLKIEEENKKELVNEQEKYQRTYNTIRNDVRSFDDDYVGMKCQIDYANNQLTKLRKLNVYNSTFDIWHSGPFGTINALRLGRLPSIPVDWSEINAAWGQTALLLNALARKVNLTFERYRIVPLANHSYIIILDDGKQLPLYGTGGFRYLWDTGFDEAMVAFLDCLAQFKEKVEADNTFCLPYRIVNGKIEDPTTGISYSIKIQFNSEEQWTKALKFLLTNLKWGLVWVSSKFADDLNTPNKNAMSVSSIR